MKRRSRDEWEDFDDLFGDEKMSRTERKLLVGDDNGFFDDDERRRGFGERLGMLLFPAGLVERSLTAVAMAAGAALVVNYLLIPGAGIASRAAKLFVPAPVASTIEAAIDNADLPGTSILDLLLSDGDSNRRSIPSGAVVNNNGSIDIPTSLDESRLVKLQTRSFAPGDRAQRLLNVNPPSDLIRPWTLRVDPMGANLTGVVGGQDVLSYLTFSAQTCSVPWTDVSTSPLRYACNGQVEHTTTDMRFTDGVVTLVRDVPPTQTVYMRLWVSWPDNGSVTPSSVSGQTADLGVEITATVQVVL